MSRFSFLDYTDSIEKMMVAWHEHSQMTLKQSTNLGNAREHFIRDVLANFLPKSVLVGSGEITDGKKRSCQQDIIIYRSDFPILTGFNIVNTYLLEGVIATIEVKSDLSTGDPTGLSSAFQNIKSVLSLNNQAIKLAGNQDEFEKLLVAHSVKTYVIGYKGWKNPQKFIENYARAANSAGWHMPHLIYQPNGCIVLNTPLANLRSAENETVDINSAQLAYCANHPFAIFFQHLLKAIVNATGGLIARTPGIDATMLYDLNNYFSLPQLPCKPLMLEEHKSD